MMNEAGNVPRPLRLIKEKCEQYWNEPIEAPETHAALECIHRWATGAEQDNDRLKLELERKLGEEQKEHDDALIDYDELQQENGQLKGVCEEWKRQMAQAAEQYQEVKAQLKTVTEDNGRLREALVEISEQRMMGCPTPSAEIASRVLSEVETFCPDKFSGERR